MTEAHHIAQQERTDAKVEEMRAKCEAIARGLRDRAAKGGCVYCMGDDIVSEIAALAPKPGSVP